MIMNFCTAGAYIAWALMMEAIPGNSIDIRRQVIGCFNDESSCYKAHIAVSNALSIHNIKRQLTCEREPR